MNKLKEYREARLMSKAELARKAGLSYPTVDRVEKGFICRMNTQRKILAALGLAKENTNLIFDGDRVQTIAERREP